MVFLAELVKRRYAAAAHLLSKMYWHGCGSKVTKNRVKGAIWQDVAVRIATDQQDPDLRQHDKNLRRKLSMLRVLEQQ